MKAHRAFLATVSLSLALLVALAAWATLFAAQAGPVAAVNIQDSSFAASTVTPTPQTGFRIYLPLIMKGWLTWPPNIPTPTATPTLTIFLTKCVNP